MPAAQAELRGVASGAAAARLADPAPPAAFAPPRLLAVPGAVTRQCRLAQAQTSVRVFCPRRLPRPWLRPWRSQPGSPLPRLTAQRADYLDRGGRTLLLSFSYGAPWEPDSGPGWQQHLWRNRPCCFLHFEVITRLLGRPLPTSGGQRAVVGGRDGVYLAAAGYGPRCPKRNRSAFWCNHAVFAWREHGVQYAATLHYFGASATRSLLGRLVAELTPTR